MIQVYGSAGGSTAKAAKELDKEAAVVEVSELLAKSADLWSAASLAKRADLWNAALWALTFQLQPFTGVPDLVRDRLAEELSEVLASCGVRETRGGIGGISNSGGT